MPKKKTPEQKKKTTKILVNYGVPLVMALILSLAIPYLILSFIRHHSIVLDFAIFSDRTLWIIAGCIFLAFVIGIIGFSIYYDLFNHTKLLNKTEDAKSKVYGDARFLSDEEIYDKFGNHNFADLGDKDVHGCLISSYRKHDQLRVSLVPKQHALICGVSGDGKSLRHLGVTIQANGKSATKPSMLVNDIKGELWNMHSKFLREQGYQTILLDLKNPYTSYRLNPINIIWKLYKEAEDMQVELSISELATRFHEYEIFHGKFTIEEYKKKVYDVIQNQQEDLQRSYKSAVKFISNLTHKDFPKALYDTRLNLLLDLTIDTVNEEGKSKEEVAREEQDIYVKLYHLYINRYKICKKLKAGLTSEQFYTEWQNTQYQKKMEKLNRASGLLLNFSKQIVPDGTGENKIWSDGAQGICAAILTAMIEDGMNPELDFREEQFSITQISNIVNRQRNDLNDFLKLRNLDSKVFDYAGPILDNPAEKTVAGYLSNLQTPLKNYLEDGIEYLMSGVDIDFNDIIARPTAIFILVPEEFPARNIIASMYITQIYNELLYQANDFAELNYALPRPFYFFWDEFGNSVKIPELPSWISLCRSRNIFFSIYVQALSQINKLYGDDDTKTIIQNCHLQVIMGSNEDATVEHFRKSFGEHTVITRTAQFDPKTDDIQFKGSSTLSKVDLVPPNILRKIDTGTIYWKMHKINPGKTHLEIIYDNLDILQIGVYDKPAEPTKPYDKAARIYNLQERNAYVEMQLKNSRKGDDDDDSEGGNGNGDGGGNASIPQGFEEITPEQLAALNAANAGDEEGEEKPSETAQAAKGNPHHQIFGDNDT